MASEVIDLEGLEWQHVDSSNLEMVGWEGDVLYVAFVSGAIYLYTDVPYEAYEGLLNADSHGQYLDEKIKPIYPYMKVETP